MAVDVFVYVVYVLCTRQSNSGKTALDWAREMGKDDCVALLVAAEAQ